MNAHKNDAAADRLRNGGLGDRLTAAANARKAALERFRARPGPDDPVAVERQAARKAVAVAREARAADRKAAREAEAAVQAAKQAARAAEQEAWVVEQAAREAEDAAREAA